MYDISGGLNLKYIAFFVVCLCLVQTFSYFDFSTREIIVGLLLFVLWPVWSLLSGIIRNGDKAVGLTQISPFLFVIVLAFLLPAFDNKWPLRVFYIFVFSLAIVTIVFFALIFFFPENPISSVLYDILTDLSGKEGLFGTKDLGDFNCP